MHYCATLIAAYCFIFNERLLVLGRVFRQGHHIYYPWFLQLVSCESHEQEKKAYCGDEVDQLVDDVDINETEFVVRAALEIKEFDYPIQEESDRVIKIDKYEADCVEFELFIFGRELATLSGSLAHDF